MAKLRRTRSESFSVPNTAEVLETRAMLSGMTGSVHAAVHATVHQAAIQTHAVQPQAFHGSAEATYSINGGPLATRSGDFSISKITVKAGSRVSAEFTGSVTSGGVVDTIKAKFIGKIMSFSTVGTSTTLNVQPTGGNIIETIKNPSEHLSETGKAVPNGTPISVILVNGFANKISGEDTFQQKGPPAFAGHKIALSFTPLA